MTDEYPLSGEAIGYRVLHEDRRGPPMVWELFEGPPMVDDGLLLPISLSEALAPEVHRARVELDIAGLRIDAWRWKEHVAVDDYVAIVSDWPDPARRHCPFHGWIVDPDWSFDRNERCVFTAVSPAFRLARDVIVYGRWMLGYDDELRHYSGLPCAFNAGGRPNRHPDLQDVSALGIERRPTTDDAGQKRTGVPVFTYDGDSLAGFWTFAEIVEYLEWLYNGQEAYIRNCDLLPADYARGAAVVTETEGLSLWAALAAAADKAGYDVTEWITNAGEGLPTSQIVVVRKHCGTAVTVKHQPQNPDGSLQHLDGALTDLFSASIAEPTSSCVTAPIVAGGRELYEIYIPLGKAWHPDSLEVPAGSRIVGPDEKRDKLLMQEEYCKRYVVGGDKFALYCDAGRLWDANTDGRYAAEPWNLDVPDMADLAGLEAGCWPVMPYRPLPCLSRVIEAGPSIDACVEISWDGGTTWYLLGGWRLLPGRLGIRLTAANLAGVVRPKASAGDGIDPVEDNLFWQLINSPSSIALALNITVAAPDRSIAAPARRDSAGTAFQTAAWFDRAAAGQVRVRTPDSIGTALNLDADTADGTADLDAIAAAVQDACEDRLVEASLPIEWMRDLRLTDVVGRIEGIEYDLQVNAGKARRSPRIVARTLNFTPQSYSMTVQLSTERKAGIV